MAIRRYLDHERLDGLLDEISRNKISVLRPDCHPLHKKMLAKRPVAALEIPNKLFLLWSDLKSMQNQLSIDVSKNIDLVKQSLRADQMSADLSLLSHSNTLETRLRKESSRICKKYHGLRWEPKESLKESSTMVMVLGNEGSLSSNENSQLINKLRIDG